LRPALWVSFFGGFRVRRRLRATVGATARATVRAEITGHIAALESQADKASPIMRAEFAGLNLWGLSRAAGFARHIASHFADHTVPTDSQS